MTLRKKALIIIGITHVCLVVILYAIFRITLMTSFAKLEAQNTRQNVERATSLLLDEILSLDITVSDWAAWDDTFVFVEDANDEYIQSNLVDETFISSRLNFMLFVNAAGQTVFGKGFDLQSQEQVPIPLGLQEHLADDALLLQHSSTESGMAEIVLLPEGPILIVSRPILTSEEEGPIRGTLIMGRYLDSAAVERLTQTVHLSLTLYRFNDPQMPPDIGLSEEKPILVRPLSAESVAGYALLKDIYGQPALIMRVDMSRDIYQQGKTSMLYFISSFLVIGMVFGGMVLLLLEKAVLSRLTRLNANVSDIGARGDLSARVSMPGRDELSSLADAINGMLDTLEHSQRELGESEEKFRSIVQQSLDGIVLTDEQGVIIEWNRGVEQITGLERAKTLALPLWDVQFQMMSEEHKKPEVYEQLTASLLEFFGTGQAPWVNRMQEQIIQRPDGTHRVIQILAFPIKTDKGWMAGSISRDITERRQAERELSRRLMEQETLFTIGQLVSSSLQIDQVLRQVAEQMTRLVGAASCAISDWDPTTGLLTVQTEYTRPDRVKSDDPINDMGESYDVSNYPATAAALRDHKPFVVYVDDPQADLQKRRLLELYDWYGVAGIPLVVQDRVTGLAEVYMHHDDGPFDTYDLRLLQSLASQVAVAIDNARLFSAARANEAAMRDLSLRLINVQEQERRFIAQELHDELGQLLTATKINIDLAQRKLSRLDEREGMDVVEPVRSRLKDASALTDKVLTNVRAITVELRPTLLDDLGVVPTLRWHLGRFATRTGIQVELDAPELPARLNPELETTIYRVAQEALTNIARHAQANRVQVQLTCLDDTVTVLVEDDGQGFDVKTWSERPREQQTLGLTGIQERAMLLDGRATITSQPGEGTRVWIELPARYIEEERV